MDSDVIEWAFYCDEASGGANSLFGRVMNRDWLLEHNISPWDSNSAWSEVRKQLLDLGESSTLTVISSGYQLNRKWILFWRSILKEHKRGE